MIRKAVRIDKASAFDKFLELLRHTFVNIVNGHLLRQMREKLGILLYGKGSCMAVQPEHELDILRQ